MISKRLGRLSAAVAPLIALACSSSSPTGGDGQEEGGSATTAAGSASITSSAGNAAVSGGSGNAGGASGATAAGSDGSGAGASGAGAAGKAGGGSGGAGGSAGAAGSNDGGGGSAGTNGGAGGSAGGGGSQNVCPSGSLAAQCKKTNANELACHFGGNPGNYQVGVELGGKAAGDMYVEAEMYRRMLGETKTAAGQTKSYSFVVNVRQPEGQPVQNGPNDGTPGLDVYVRGTAPELSSICYAPAQAPAMIWIGGDSTVCDQSTIDYSGWGQHLPQFFDVPVSVANYADSGESSGSFLNSAAMFGAIKSRWHAGDWFFVQLGHNDKNTIAATFQANMKSFVTQSKAAGVHIVLVTPTSRVGYALAAEHVNSTGANLPQIIRDLGKAENVPVIDLTVTTWNWLQTVNWKDYFALGTDHTHTNPKGADVIAGFVHDAVRAQALPIASDLRGQ